jgi:tetratricopeptide (TPR) repeat protein
MKVLVPFFTKLYQYVTAFLIVASPLFFIPGTSFAPEVTYYVTLSVLVAIALFSYVFVALATRSWHSISRLEFISYFVFSAAVLLSVAFAHNRKNALFGDAFNAMSGASLLSLPAIMYLVRTLPDALRTKLKYVLAVVLAVSTFILTLSMMVGGTAVDAIKQVFSGFSNAVSFSAYVGLFVVGAFFFTRKAKIKIWQKTILLVGSLVFLAWIVSIALTDSVRPNFMSSLTVIKGVTLTDGLFGIGAGDYTRAWQLYRPESVIASQYFAYDFNQGFSTMTTLATTIGLLGLIAFLMLTLSALYSTWRSYRFTREGQDHYVTGFLTLALIYLSIVAWFVPLSFAMLVLWMVLGGFGLGKAHLTEFHPSKKLAFLMVPLAILLVVQAGFTVQKARAFLIFGKAQVLLSASGPVPEMGTLLKKAQSIYAYDGFYRAEVEYIILDERALVSTNTGDQNEFQKNYLTKAQAAVNAGLEAVRLNNTNYQNYVSLGRAYELAIPFQKEDGYKHAKDAYEQAVRLYPNNPYLYVMLARLEASAGTKEGVRAELTEALKKKQNFADALYLMSQLSASEEKIDEALQYAIEAVKNAPNDPLVYVQAGLLFYGKKNYADAVTALSYALQRDQNNVTIAYFLALSLRDGGRPDLAKTLADELIKRDPNNADIKALVQSVSNAAAPAATSTPAKKK